jgi:hypothetical protein
LLTAFPAATPIKRVTLAEAVSLVAAAGSDTTDSDVTARFAAAQD